MPIQKILVPTDFSTFSDIALDQALELAHALSARVTLLHTYEVPAPTKRDSSYDTAEMLRLLDASARSTLDGIRAEALRRWKGPSREIETEVAIGVPYLTIVEVARRGAYDLIVMGTHGRTGLSHMLIGSVAERVVRSADCPVLTVRGGLGVVRPHDVPDPGAKMTP